MKFEIEANIHIHHHYGNESENLILKQLTEIGNNQKEILKKMAELDDKLTLQSQQLAEIDAATTAEAGQVQAVLDGQQAIMTV